ncbi:transposase [Enterobacteriaceae bacterium ESL0689]|nr:transposase [Enterobacteriaceae bacterium ESL0689]
MKRISPERKTAILAKLLPPYNMAVSTVAQMDGISETTLYNWRNQAKQEGKPVPGADKNSEQWPTEARFTAIVETAIFSEAEVAEYCRKKDLYPEQSQKENKQLKRKLIRKEKALAEAAAILVLRKKLRDYYGETDGDD